MKKNWNELSYEEKKQNIREIDETYDFASYEDEADAGYNVRLGYENDPDWFNFAVTDLEEFERDVCHILASFTDYRIVWDTDKERIYVYGCDPEEYCNADIEAIMQEAIDSDTPDTWEVQTAEYWPEDDCWSAKLLCINI